jgi:hypothetical protein
MKYRSCYAIENGNLTINGQINNDKPIISFCCAPIDSRPQIAFSETPEKTLSDFKKMNVEVITESYRNALFSAIGEDTPPHKCSGCAYFTLSDWNNFDGIIKFVNLSIIPHPVSVNVSTAIIASAKADDYRLKTMPYITIVYLSFLNMPMLRVLFTRTQNGRFPAVKLPYTHIKNA